MLWSKGLGHSAGCAQGPNRVTFVKQFESFCDRQMWPPAHRLYFLQEPALPQMSGAGGVGLDSRAHYGPAACGVFPRRLHPAGRLAKRDHIATGSNTFVTKEIFLAAALTEAALSRPNTAAAALR